MNKIQEKFMRISIWLSVILFAIRLLIAGIVSGGIFQVVYKLWGYAGEAIGISVIAMYFYNTCLWKKLNVYKIPVLASRYIGKIIFTWNDEMGERDVTLEIKQTFLNVKVIASTSESVSDSINASIEYINDVPYLHYMYINSPDVNLRGLSPIHFGHAYFRLTGDSDLVGQYFTDRKTVGRIEVKKQA